MLLDGIRLRASLAVRRRRSHEGGEVAIELEKIAGDARLFGQLAEGQPVRYADDAGALVNGKVVEKCRWGALVLRDDGAVVAVGFRKLWPSPRARGVSALRPELAELVEDLLRSTAKGDAIALDAIGDAIGARAIAPRRDRRDALGDRGARPPRRRRPEGGRGELHLKTVVAAARELSRGAREAAASRRDRGALRALASLEVQHALALARDHAALSAQA